MSNRVTRVINQLADEVVKGRSVPKKPQPLSKTMGDNLAKNVAGLVDTYAECETEMKALKKRSDKAEKELLELFGVEIDGKLKLPAGTVLKGTKKKLCVVSGTARKTLQEALLIENGVSKATIEKSKKDSAVPLSWKVEDL